MTSALRRCRWLACLFLLVAGCGGKIAVSADASAEAIPDGAPSDAFVAVDACTPVACLAGMCGLAANGCGGTIFCGNCDAGGGGGGGGGSVPHACQVTGGEPQGVAGCACALSTSDLNGGCCEETEAWIAADKSQCGPNFCSGPCAAYCACYVSKCKGMAGCP